MLDTEMIDGLKEHLEKPDWGYEDYRDLKRSLFASTIKELDRFVPTKPDIYSNNPIQVLDFFCGAGGTSLGFSALNGVVPAFKMLGGCDIDPISALTYSHNYGTPLINRDITELADDDQELTKLLNGIGFDPNKPTILIGCAPCQGFTSHRKRHWSENDDDIRNNLVNVFAEIVERINPDAIVMENVPEFLSKKYWKYFSSAKKSYEKNGYVVKQRIYNAASFGVPQERFRTILIAMKKQFLLPEELFDYGQYRTVRDAIGSLPAVSAGVADPLDPMHKSAGHKKSTIEVIKQIPHDGGNRPHGVGPKCLDRTKGFSDSYGRLFWDRPSITITHYARNPASGRYSHPTQDRGLTAREAAILQSFPNGFVFDGSFDDIYRQIGEAVPPLMATAIAIDVLVELVSKVPSKKQLSEGISSIDTPVSSSYSSVIAGIKHKNK